jgi:hypothetical protein
MKQKRQHIIPKCYQKLWCDPATPPKQTPYIWMISKDGQQRKRKAPEKAFVSTDVYTIRLPSGDRGLVIEETLAKIEGTFVKLIEHKVKKRYSLDSQDKANLCVFAAVMFTRVDTQGRVYAHFLREVHDKIKRMEETHKAEPSTSLEIGAMLENARPEYIAISLQMLAELYYSMSLGIFVAPATDPFITSDSPIVWYNPEAYKWPPFWRSPGLAQEKVEVTMPLTPQFALFLSHNDKFSGYRELPANVVQELNRHTRFHCDQWFVSWQGEVRDEWFDVRTPPEDRWENSPEGRRAAEQRDKHEELRRLYEESRASNDGVEPAVSEDQGPRSTPPEVPPRELDEEGRTEA